MQLNSVFIRICATFSRFFFSSQILFKRHLFYPYNYFIQSQWQYHVLYISCLSVNTLQILTEGLYLLMVDFFCFTHRDNARKKPCQSHNFFFFLPWNQAISSLKSGGIQFKERRDVISMWHRDQSIHNLLPCLAFLLWSRKVAISLLVRHKGYLLASAPIINSPITLWTSNNLNCIIFFVYILLRTYCDWLWSA